MKKQAQNSAQIFWRSLLFSGLLSGVLSGCALCKAPQDVAMPPFVSENFGKKACPRPRHLKMGKDVPRFIEDSPLCDVDNIEVLLIRDARLRQYIEALEATILCHEGFDTETVH